MRTFTRYGVVLALAGLAIGSLASSALGDTAGEDDDTARTTWTVEPANSDGTDGRVSIRHDIDPGDSVSDAVEVRNFGPSAATFRIYASDGVVGDSGAFDILPPGQESTEGGSWVRFEDVPGVSAEPMEVVDLHLEPESSTVIPVSIAVPEDAVPGDHPAGIVAELVPSGDDGVELTSRVGVRLHLRVTGALEAQIVPTDVHTTWRPSWNPFASGSVLVRYQLHNTGNVRLGADSQLHLAGPAGVFGTALTDSRREVLPGQQIPIATDVSLWGLIWSGGEIVVAAHAVGDDALDDEPATTRTALQLWTVPWAQVALLLAGAVVVILLRRRRRSSVRRVQERIDAAVAEATLEMKNDDAKDGEVVKTQK